MEEIKVGDYYRTKNGLIRKVETIKSGKRQFTRTTETLVNGRHKLEDIEKHSKNIIDLIEKGDYVNEYKVTAINPITIRIEKSNNFWSNKILDDFDIKSIVTHEQFSNIEYRLEN